MVAMNSSSPALLLDRDGVINEDRGFVHKPDQVEFIPGIFQLCKQFQQAGWELAVVTNQSGIAHDYYSENDLRALHCWLSGAFRDQGVQLSHFYFCPHHPQGILDQYRCTCTCRKPAPGMILQAARELNLDLSHSIMIGDRVTDMQAAHAGGVGRAFLLGARLPCEEVPENTTLIQGLDQVGAVIFGETSPVLDLSK